MSPDPGLLGRDARWMHSLGKSEGSEGRNVLFRFEPGGNKPIGANEDGPDLVPLGPVGKTAVDTFAETASWRPWCHRSDKQILPGGRREQPSHGRTTWRPDRFRCRAPAIDDKKGTHKAARSLAPD